MEDPDASRDLGDDPAAEGGLLGGFDQVDLHQTGQVGLRGELPQARGDCSIAVGWNPQTLSVDRLQGGPRLVDTLAHLCRLRVSAQGFD